MSVLELILLLFFSVHSFASPILRRGAQSFKFKGDAPFTVDSATLAAALTCPNGNPSSSSPPVLLVHGTSTTGQETWGDGYVPALAAAGYTACYVTLPGRAMGDMQVSSQYVAYNLHQISSLSGGMQTAVISHSQGGPDTQWALRFWPSTRNITRAFIPLSPDFAGIELFDSKLSDVCVGDLCQACLWQQSAGSNYYTAMHDDTFGTFVPTTSIWSQSDGVVMPAQNNAQLPSATVLSVQDLCPGRIVQHVFMTIDAAAYAIALDALNNGGTASISRVKKNSWSQCLHVAAPHMDISIAAAIGASIKDLIDGFLLGSPRVSQEPGVDSYALAAEE